MEQKNSDVFGLLSLIFGIVAFLSCLIPVVGVIFMAISIIFGIVSLVRSERTMWKAIAGVSLSVTGMALGFLVVFWFFSISDPTLGEEGYEPSWAKESHEPKVEKKIENEDEEERYVFEIGDVIEYGDTLFSVDKVNKIKGASSKEGYEQIQVDVTIENGGNKTIDYSTSDFKMLNNQGEVVDANMDLHIERLEDGSLSPGEKVSGKIQFELPIDDPSLMLVFGHIAYVDLSKN